MFLNYTEHYVLFIFKGRKVKKKLNAIKFLIKIFWGPVMIISI